MIGLAGLVSSDITSLNEVKPSATRFVYVSYPADVPLPPGGQELFERHSSGHPLIAAYALTGDGSATKISDLVSADEWHANPRTKLAKRPRQVPNDSTAGSERRRPRHSTALDREKPPAKWREITGHFVHPLDSNPEPTGWSRVIPMGPY